MSSSSRCRSGPFRATARASRASPSEVRCNQKTRASSADCSRRTRPAASARVTSSVIVLCVSCMRSASSVTVDRPPGVVLIIRGSRYRLGVSPSSRAIRSLARRNFRSAPRNAAASRNSASDGSMPATFLLQTLLNRLLGGGARVRFPEDDDVVLRPEHVGEADVLATEPLVGANEPRRLVPVLRERERRLVAGQLHVERASERRRGDEIDLVADLDALLVGKTRARLLRVVFLRAAAPGREQADEHGKNEERPPHGK